jgi:hypothetical protein
MAIMASVGTRHFHAGMWVSRLSVAFMSHVLHFETPKPEIDNLTDCDQVFVLNDEDTLAFDTQSRVAYCDLLPK